MFDGLSSHAHGPGHAVEPTLHPVEHVLILPALDDPPLGRCAPGSERTGEALAERSRNYRPDRLSPYCHLDDRAQSNPGALMHQHGGSAAPLGLSASIYFGGGGAGPPPWRRESSWVLSMFIRRFLLHAMPDGFHRIRHYGFLANRRRVEKLLLCRSLLAVAVPVDRGEERRQSAISRTIFVLAAAGGWNPSARYCDRSRHALRHGTTAHDRSPMITVLPWPVARATAATGCRAAIASVAHLAQPTSPDRWVATPSGASSSALPGPCPALPPGPE